MPELSAEQIAHLAFDLNLLTDRQLQDVWAEFGRRNVSAEEFVQLLVRRELLTNFQLERMLRGERSGYFYGNYKVIYLVAVGSFARVYRAVHKETGRVVAVKVLRRRYSDDPVQATGFQQEGKVGMSLRHANIVPVYEVVSEGRTHFLVMEFVEGRNLREFLKVRHKLDPLEATRLMVDIASGLNYAAERGIFHRDLKLTNVLVSGRGQAKLVDFGLAGADPTLSEEALANHPNPRTIDYAGLERATGVRKDDARSDIFFSGCIYYHMLSGKAALQETRDRIQRLSKSRYTDVVSIQTAEPSVPPSVSAVVNKSMHINPEKRYQTPGEMLLDLAAAMHQLTDDGQAAAPMRGAATAPVAAAATEKIADKHAQPLAIPEALRRPVMFVGSNARLQDSFREALKQCGYRVLVMSDPTRALARFEESSKAADCVIFSTCELGRAAYEAFEQFAVNEATKDVPAVLLLDPPHRQWKKQATQGRGRLVLPMPIKGAHFRTMLTRLVPPLRGAEPEPQTTGAE